MLSFVDFAGNVNVFCLMLYVLSTPGDLTIIVERSGHVILKESIFVRAPTPTIH